MEILALFEADDCQFLSSKAHLESFAKKISSIRSVSSEQSQEDGLNVFQLLKQISECVYCELENVTEADGSPNNPELLLSVDETLKISKLLKYVCSLFIVPYLEVTFGDRDSRKIPISKSLSVKEKLKLLFENVNSLCCLSEKNILFQKILMKSCSLYLLTGLLQLCFSPKSARNIDIQGRKNCLRFLNLYTTSWLSMKQLITDTLAIQDTASKNSTLCAWLVHKCGTVLTRILLGKDGIETIIVSMVSSFDANPEEAGESWERIVALSSIISTLPSSGVTPKDYCRLACPQLQKLLVASRKNVTLHSKDVIRVGVTTLHALHEKYPIESKVFERHLCHPLLICEEGFDSGIKRDMEVELCQCIETLHQVCVSVGVAPASLVLMLLKPYVKILLLLLIKIPASCHLRSKISDLFDALLKKSDNNDLADIIMNTFCQQTNLKIPNKKLNFAVNENGYLAVTDFAVSDPPLLLQELDRKVDILLSIITKHEFLSGDVFLRLIERLCDPSKNIPQQIHPHKILTSSERATEAMELNEERFITFGLLTTLLDTFDPNILLRNNRQILEFVKTAIYDLPNKLRENVTESIEVLKICASVVGISMLSNLDSTEMRTLNDLVSGLKEIHNMDNVLDDETKELISDLVIAISTYGAVNNVKPADFSESMNKCLQDLRTLSNTDEDVSKTKVGVSSHKIELNKVSACQDAVKKAENDGSGNTEGDNTYAKLLTDLSQGVDDAKDDFNIDKSISEALQDIHSTAPALKGGSIRYLTKCIKNTVPAALSQVKVLVELFLEFLEDNDSFVYLSAVQGLAVISTTCGKNLEHGTLLEKIVTEFLSDEKLESANGIFCKMKLGEVITRIIHDMGDMAPSHASVLLPMFLTLSRHSDSTMRGSAISNFAELAPMAPSMLSSLQFEIRDCLCGNAVSDRDVMVRRAAVYAIRSIISQLSDAILKVFAETIKDIYGVLKKIYTSDDDNTVQLHAQLALEELDEIMRSTIFKPQVLSKKIIVLP